MLVELGAEVRVVNRSVEALAAFYDFEPDLLTLDLHMPPPDGVEILRSLRSARAFEGYLPVIVLTSDDTKTALDTAFLLGADDFLNKPLDRTEVVVRVRNLLLIRRLYLDLAGLTGAEEPPITS